MVKTPVKFWKGNLEAVAEMVHAYNKLISHSIPEIQKIMLDTASRLLNGRKDDFYIETMAFGVKKTHETNGENVDFYFCPPHENFLLIEYRG